ncbi:MAG: hypothetical protein HFH64_14445 [Lachnospiraceae bacterium]|nr:hypothetical protein [Lachnospiraceae bacterium]
MCKVLLFPVEQFLETLTACGSALSVSGVLFEPQKISAYENHQGELTPDTDAFSRIADS